MAESGGSRLDLVYLRQLAEATTEGPWLMQGYANAVVLSLLDRIEEWEATDKANADDRKRLLGQIEELEGKVCPECHQPVDPDKWESEWSRSYLVHAGKCNEAHMAKNPEEP